MVLFCIVTGVALTGVEHKEPVLHMLDRLTATFSRMTATISKITPYGVFCIMGHSAGTLGLEELGRLQVYVLAYVAVACVLAFWLLPGLVTSLTDFTFREVFGPLKDALLTAFLTANMFIVLPSLTEHCKALMSKQEQSGEGARMAEVVVPASLNFPSVGKLMSISFVLFSGWFTNVEIGLTELPRLALMALLTNFGSTTMAVPFLLGMYRIPDDMFQMFMALSVVTKRFSTLIAAVHCVALTLLVACAATGRLRIQRAALVRYVVIGLGLLALAVGGTRFVFENLAPHSYTMDTVLGGMRLTTLAPAVVLQETPAPPAVPDPPGTKLDKILERGELRVGFGNQAIPYAFRNSVDDLVGLDVEMAHHLARELDVRLQFVPLLPAEMVTALNDDVVDVIMSGIVVTTERAARMLFTQSTVDETIAFLVRDHQRKGFQHLPSVPEHIRVACFDLPYYREKLQRILPQVQVISVSTIDECVQLLMADEVEGVLFTAERGSSLSLLNPHLSVVVPGSHALDVPVAYAVARSQPELVAFLDSWIALKRKDRTLDRLYDYWMLGKNAEPHRPRWNVWDDVLGW